MEVREGYKQTEIGIIPEVWSPVKLKSFGRAEGGFAFSSKKFTNDGKYQVVKMSNLYGGDLDLRRSQSFINEPTEEELNYLLNADEIIITLTGTVGKTDFGYSYKIKNEKNLLLNQRVGRLIIEDSVDPVFISYEVRTRRFLKQFFEKSKGGTGNQSNVSTKDIELILIPLPPTKSEQTAIAKVLSDIDELISSLEKLIEKKKLIKQGTMQQLLTGKKRLPGFSGKWEVKKLGEIAFFLKGKGLPKSALDLNGKYECIHYGELFTKYNEQIGEITSRTENDIDSFKSQTNDVLMPTSDVTPNGLATASCIMKDDVILGGDILVIRVNQNLLNGVFLSYCITNDKAQVLGLVSGITVFHLYAADMKKFQLYLPPVKEQEKITETLSDMEFEIEALEQRLDKYKFIKQGMMLNLLTGKIRLVKPEIKN